MYQTTSEFFIQRYCTPKCGVDFYKTIKWYKKSVEIVVFWK